MLRSCFSKGINEALQQVLFSFRCLTVLGFILINEWALDCSQSPYFSVGFSRPVFFDGAATILVCKSERDLGRVSKLPGGTGVGVSIEWGMGSEKIEGL